MTRGVLQDEQGVIKLTLDNILVTWEQYEEVKSGFRGAVRAYYSSSYKGVSWKADVVSGNPHDILGGQKWKLVTEPNNQHVSMKADVHVSVIHDRGDKGLNPIQVEGLIFPDAQGNMVTTETVLDDGIKDLKGSGSEEQVGGYQLSRRDGVTDDTAVVQNLMNADARMVFDPNLDKWVLDPSPFKPKQKEPEKPKPVAKILELLTKREVDLNE